MPPVTREGRTMRAITLVSVGAVVLCASAAAARAGDIRVPGDFKNLQQALDAAAPGDRILLEPRTYRGSYHVETTVAIVGEPGTRIRARRTSRRHAGTRSALTVQADLASVEGVTFVDGTLDVVGDGCTVTDCDVAIRVGTGSYAVGINIDGNDATVTGGNVTVSGRRAMWSQGIVVQGDDAAITGTAVLGGPETGGILIVGNDAVVEDNSVTLPGGAGGIAMSGQDGVLSGNVLEGTDISVTGNGISLTGNSVTGVPAGRPSFMIDGDSNLLTGNGTSFGGDTGFVVWGDGNRLEGNTVADNGFTWNGVDSGHGFVVRGDGNLLVDNEADGCLGDGFRVVSNFGTLEGNTLLGCTGTGAVGCGLANWAGSTDVTDSSFEGNGVDVVDGTGFDAFDGNTWHSGGPGYVGNPNGAFLPDFGDPAAWGGWD
jgi:hypothetical protein